MNGSSTGWGCVAATVLSVLWWSALTPVHDNPPTLALDVLVSIRVDNEHGDGYRRELFVEGRDEDRDGCPTRAEVLIRDAVVAPTVGAGCAVVGGTWISSYDSVEVTNVALLQVDHVVALKEAWDSGAWAWDQNHRDAFANDLDDSRSLRAVTAASNRAKADADPSNWIPSDAGAVCDYLADWVAIKTRWDLSMDQSEIGRVRNLLTDRCPGQTVAAWPDAPAQTTAVTPDTTMVVAVQPVVFDPGGTGCDPSYPDVCIPSPPPDLDCSDIPFRTFLVLPPDPHHFDADHNGLGCEQPG